MIAATKSSEECSASDSTPKLPVRNTRKLFSDTSITAEPTLNSAARFFSLAISLCSETSIARLDYLNSPTITAKMAFR